MTQRCKRIGKYLAIWLSGAMLLACGSPSSQTQSIPSSPQKEEGQDSASPTTHSSLTVKDIAMYEGSDREQLLLENAKKEGTVNFYTSMTNEDAAKLIDGFEKEYGIKVQLWRAGSDKVLQKVVTEAKAGHHEVDIVDVSGPELEALHREGLLQEVKSPYLQELIPEAIPSHREWVATRSNIFVHAYNTQKVKKEDLPQTWDDLLDPKWKGRLGIEVGDNDWFATLIKDMGEEKGLSLFRNIVKQNQISVRKGHTLLTELTASGEVPLSLTNYNFTAEQFKKKGAPLDWFVLSPAVARPNGSGLVRQAPHPYAAVLFYDYVISKGQNVLAGLDFAVTNKNVETPYSKLQLKFVDPAVMLDEYEKWDKLYNETIVKQNSK